ncbi:MAG: CDP-glycerol glycerophosphotransferase family protein [Christensenellaceae bacterium]
MKIKRVLRGVKYVLLYPIYGLSCLIPKKENVWIFGAWNGNAYADNTRYVYEYVSKNTNIKAYWVTKEPEICRMLQTKGFRAYMYNSLKGVFVAMFASVAFITQTHEDVNYFACGKIKAINTWHGVMMKKILFDTQNMYRSPDVSIRWSYKYFPFGNIVGRNDYVVATSEMYRPITRSAFNVPDDHIYINGYPRNDLFHSNNPPELIRKLKETGKKVIIYLPTHRNFGAKHETNPMIDIDTIDEKLNAEGWVMLYKPHYHEMKNFSQKHNLKAIVSSSEYDFTHNINTYLPFCDLLITDYSGAYFDFLLTNKPVVFFDYDLEWYIKNNSGLYFDYDEIAKGPHCKTWDEVFSACKKILEYDSWYEDRIRLKEKVFKFDDSQNAKRVYEYACCLTKRG